MRDVIGELRELATHCESEYTPGAEGYRAIDEMAVELEVAEFLYSLVRVEKPKKVVESGAGKGYSTLAIAGALQRNEYGKLWSYEPDDELREIAQNRVGDFENVFVVSDSPGSDYYCLHPKDPDFVFLDSGPTRVQEIPYWLYRSCTLVIHDAYRYVDALQLMGGQMFPNPRGLWVRTKDWNTKYGPIQREPHDPVRPATEARTR